METKKKILVFIAALAVAAILIFVLKQFGYVSGAGSEYSGDDFFWWLFFLN